MSNRLSVFGLFVFSFGLVACDQVATSENTQQLAAEECAHHEGCPHSSEGQVAQPDLPRARITLGDAPVLGPANAPITLVVFSDFECPFCSRGADRLKALRAKHGANLKIAFKQRPLPFHRSARPAAKASLAAANQGKFWEYHDALFADQRALDREALEKRAQDLGLDLERFRADFDSEATDARLRADEAEAERLAVQGTPTFFVNGEKLVGAQPVEVFDAAIARARAAR